MFIHAVTVSVSDQDRAFKFYTEKLGFEVRMDEPMKEGGRWIMVAPPGTQTTIVLQLEPEKARQHFRHSLARARKSDGSLKLASGPSTLIIMGLRDS